MLHLLPAFLAAIRAFFRSRVDTSLEILALRQQVAVLKRKRPRPALTRLDRFFWTAMRQLWPRWSDVLAIVRPETVVGWHRAGFRLYWRWRSRPRDGRPKISKEVRTLIRTIAAENSGWGAPKIHGEMLKLGFQVCERTVARYLRRLRRRGDPGKRWLAFLANHRETIVAMDFFAVPTLTFKLMYCFFVTEHGRRRILHFNITSHQTSEWVVQQLREVFPEILDHIIALNEPHLRWLMRDYVNYHHNDRIHDSLAKDTPNRRPVESEASPAATVVSSARLGGLYHRYSWCAAA